MRERSVHTRPGIAARSALGLSLWSAIAMGPGAAVAQDRPAADLSPAVKQLLSAAYLTEHEKRDLRLKHGQWTIDDLSTPALAARAALVRGAYLDASLKDREADPEDRAEALLFRGELDQAIDAIHASPSARARRLRAETLIHLGKAGEARVELDALAEMDPGMSAAPAEASVEIARGLMLRLRLPREDGSIPSADEVRQTAQTVLAILKTARERHDPLSWSVPLLEAQILADNGNHADATTALGAALSLNPRLASALATAGESAAAQFDFSRAQKIAEKLDELGGPGSPLGAVVTARLRLKQSDPDAADAALNQVLERSPKQRDALALRAAAAAARFDENQTRERLAAFDAIYPGSALALTEVGRTLSLMRQYEPGAAMLLEAARRAPAWPEPYVELGLLSVQAAKDAEAEAALLTAQSLDPYNVRAANSLKLVREMKTYARFESDHFTVRCRPGVDEVLAAEMLPILERIHARVTGNSPGGIDFEPPGKTTIDLMPDHQWFAVRITGMPAVHTIAASTGPLVAMEAPRSGAGSSLGPYDWARVIQHEYTHTVTLARTKNRLPHWFTEAAAVYLEDSPRAYDRCQMLARAIESNTLFDFDAINVAFVRPAKPTDRGQAYAQGHWMYEFIVDRFGPRAPLDLMDRYADGAREPDAMKAVLGVTREQFLEQFKDWARQQLLAWGMQPKPGVPSLMHLLKEEARVRASADGAASEAEGAAELPEPTPAMVDRWLSLFPDHPQVLSLAVAFALEERHGKPDASMKPLLERYAAARTVDPLPHKLLARLALDGPTPTDAIEHLEYLDAREQNSTGLAVQLAKLYAGAGRWAQMSAKAERATRIAPFDPAARELAATAALKLNDLDTAQRHLTALTKLEPDREIHRQRLEALDARRKK